MNRALAYVHDSRPPYQRIAGPIYPQAISEHIIGHSVQSSAQITVSASDIQEEWIRPGMCWLLESSIGEDPWAGFVVEEALPYKPDSITISLLGPKEALLSVEVAVRLPVPVSRGQAVQRVLEIAQELNIGLFPGVIEQEGAAVSIDVRAETVSQFIDTIKESSAMDWRERCVVADNQITFYLDFGLLKHATNIVLQAQDLVDGTNEFTRNQVISSLTVLGQAGSFATREANSTRELSNRTGAAPNEEGISPLDPVSRALLASRDIGPAASRHNIEISERMGGSSLSSYIEERHLELLRGVDQVTLTIDATRNNGRLPKLGDVVSLRVPGWALDLDVEADIHIIEIRSMPDQGKRELLANVLLPEEILI